MNISKSAVIVDFSNSIARSLNLLPSIKRMSKTFKSKPNKVSVVVPIFNEIEAVPDFHAKLALCLQRLPGPYEIIYVDDNSNDGTYEWLISQNKESNAATFKVLRKKGKRGKAYSLMQGFENSTGSTLVMIDGDLQYPPSEISHMITRLSSADIVVSNRKYNRISKIREIVSKTFRHVFGKTFFGIDSDIQSGLKVFKREVFETIKFSPGSAWSFDLEFLYRAKFAGFRIVNHDIAFASRIAGKSKVSLLSSIFEIGGNALTLKFARLQPVQLLPKNHYTMQGAGIGYKNRKFISHTTLPLRDSAFRTFSKLQIFLSLAFLCFSILALRFTPLIYGRTFITIISILYFIDTFFNLYLILTSLRKPIEASFDHQSLKKLDGQKLPIYSILCPLYKEAKILRQFLNAIAKIDWPKDKLDVLLLLEEDDKETIEKIALLSLPSYVKTIIVPDSQPKTKPKACNYGLSRAVGKYLVIYDAEDIPDPLQLKKAYLSFQTLPPKIACLQAKLNYYNPNQNLLTRLFAAEYSLWFDLTLTGLQSLNTSIPLGGTSNHFRTGTLRKLHGWDPFNVTEDADLGIRLFKKGYKTAIIDSTTLEEATSVLKNWFRQRSRWIKGYLQTYLVHTRDFAGFARSNGWKHALIFQLTIGGKLLFLLVNPLLWIATIVYFVFYKFASPVIELIYYPPLSYIAVFSWIFGNFLFLYFYMIACAKRNQWDLVKYVFFVPLYWLMMSYAGGVALYQLIFKPHYWEKTVHGFHLKRQSVVSAISRGLEVPILVPSPTPAGNGIFTGFINFSFDSFLRGFFLSLYYFLFLVGDIAVIRILHPDRQIFSSYLTLSLVGKSIFVGSLLVSFATLWVLKKVSVRIKEKNRISYLVLTTFITSWLAVMLLELRVYTYIPFLAILSGSISEGLLPSFSIAMMCFAIANVFILYNFRKRVYNFLIVAYIAILTELAAILLVPINLAHMTRMIVYLAGADTLLMFFLHLNKEYSRIFENNISGLFGLLRNQSSRKSWEERRMSILIFNWRDTRHIFAGGAEVYVQELAKRWARQGNKVTLFCGNDSKDPSFEVIDGVEIVRRGGTYTVYLFAFIYYLLKFRDKYDLIIDCENGIPFFTPLYVNRPVILLIHHVHQEVIRKYLGFPMNAIAGFLESKFMPIIYKNKQIITVSGSSKVEIVKLGFTKEDNIEIVHNGNSIKNNSNVEKTDYPSFVYLGRLQDYKNIDIAITAFAQIAPQYNTARLKIVGFGESLRKLKRLALDLGISDKVEFLGKVTDSVKTRVLGEAWAALQPSQLEGWGITVIEANACKTPVIASNVNGLRDSVVDDKTGILVEYANTQQFANAMEQLIKNAPLRQRLSRDAYLWSKNFSWDKSAEVFYDLLGQSIPLPPASPAFSPVGNNNIVSPDDKSVAIQNL